MLGARFGVDVGSITFTPNECSSLSEAEVVRNKEWERITREWSETRDARWLHVVHEQMDIMMALLHSTEVEKRTQGDVFFLPHNFDV